VSDLAGGVDLVQSSVAFNLSSVADSKGSVENLALIGAGNIAGTGNALANTINGNGGSNVISGLVGSDSLFGNGGNDVVKGDVGNDVLNGGNGIDRLYGGVGNDSMTGGALADRFVFDTAPNAATNRDIIVDFQHNLDDVWLNNAVFKALASDGGLKAAFFHAGTAAHDTDDRIIYNKATGALFYDADGTGAQAKIQFAALSNKALLTAADFVVI
jgi:serralysin